MKNALILTGVWLGILVTAYAIVFWDQGVERPLPISVLEQQIQTMDPGYIHPDRLFSVSLPMGWSLAEDIDVALISDPNEMVTVRIVATDKEGLAPVLDEAFALEGLGEEFSQIASVSLPIGEWYGEDVSVTYRSQESHDVAYIRTQRADDWTILLIARGPERALEVLSENIEWIWDELAIPAVMPTLL